MKMLLAKNSLVTTKNIKEKNLVLAVIKSDISDFIRGKFETKAQILAMRFALAKLLASFASYKIFFFNIYL